MIARFLLLWFALAAGVYGWIWLLRRRDRKTTTKIAGRAIAAGAIAAALITALFFLNHISGV